jgi:IPT/TIG domain/Nidogen-like/Carboxypeptidase regulatory-like domain
MVEARSSYRSRPSLPWPSGARRKRLTLALLVLALALVLAPAASSYAAPFEPGFEANTLEANDDGSTGLVNLPFPIDFFGTTYSSLYVNNNGNVTFTEPLWTYTPEGLTTFGSPIIAPFWADVDTAVSGSALVTYGTGTVNGHQAFGVNWPGVDCFVTTEGGLDYFQMLIIDRSDIAPGDFDIEFNYNGINWDSGQASGGNEQCREGTSAAVGYTNGSTNAFELAGSFEDGAFLDGGPHALISGSQNSTVLGRYIFPIRNGGEGGSVIGTVTDSAYNPVGGALVSVCGTGEGSTSCYLGNTGSDGGYAVLGVPAGTYTATVSPPSGSSDNEAVSSSFTVAGGEATTEDFTLTGPTPPPNGTSIEGFGETTIGEDEVPVINWSVTSPITTHACSGGTVTATITAQNSSTGETETTAPVTLTENPLGSGTFTGSLPAVYPLHGAGTVTITVSGCPSPEEEEAIEFTIYIDPSGTVVDGNNGDAPVAGATVTLLNSDSLTGVFTPVEQGSAVMSPANRVNPDTSREDGTFGWDTVPGFYEVEATKEGCGTVTTPAFQVPPPQAELKLVLHCTAAAAPVVERIRPTKGPTTGGTIVTIKGTNLDEATAVDFGSTPAASFTIDSSTSITAVSPQEPAGKVDVTVTTPGGTSALINKDRFKFTPTVTNVSPNAGPAAGGTSTIINGSGFALGTSATKFKFGKTRATSVDCISTTECEVIAPAHPVEVVDVRAIVNKAASPKNPPDDQFTYN